MKLITGLLSMFGTRARIAALEQGFALKCVMRHICPKLQVRA